MKKKLINLLIWYAELVSRKCYLKYIGIFGCNKLYFHIIHIMCMCVVK